MHGANFHVETERNLCKTVYLQIYPQEERKTYVYCKIKDLKGMPKSQIQPQTIILLSQNFNVCGILMVHVSFELNDKLCGWPILMQFQRFVI